MSDAPTTWTDLWRTAQTAGTACLEVTPSQLVTLMYDLLQGPSMPHVIRVEVGAENCSVRLSSKRVGEQASPSVLVTP